MSEAASHASGPEPCDCQTNTVCVGCFSRAAQRRLARLMEARGGDGSEVDLGGAPTPFGQDGSHASTVLDDRQRAHRAAMLRHLMCEPSTGEVRC